VLASVLNEPSHTPPSWLDRLLERHPIFCMAGTFAVSLLVLTFIHVSIYWVVRSKRGEAIRHCHFSEPSVTRNGYSRR